MEKPFVPFYKPYGMSDEEYMYEVRIAEQRLAEWEAMQEDSDMIFHECPNCNCRCNCNNQPCSCNCN